MRVFVSRASLSILALAAVVGAVAVQCGGGGGGGGGNGPTAPPTPGFQSVTVEIQDDAFVPRSVKVQPGDTVTWVFRGSHSGHTVTEQNGLWNSGAVFGAPGATFSRTFTTAELGRTFLYYCQTHQGCCQMQGSVQVGDSAPRPTPGYE